MYFHYEELIKVKLISFKTSRWIIQKIRKNWNVVANKLKFSTQVFNNYKHNNLKTTLLPKILGFSSFSQKQLFLNFQQLSRITCPFLSIIFIKIIWEKFVRHDFEITRLYIHKFRSGTLNFLNLRLSKIKCKRLSLILI